MEVEEEEEELNLRLLSLLTCKLSCVRQARTTDTAYDKNYFQFTLSFLCVASDGNVGLSPLFDGIATKWFIGTVNLNLTAAISDEYSHLCMVLWLSVGPSVPNAKLKRVQSIQLSKIIISAYACLHYYSWKYMCPRKRSFSYDSFPLPSPGRRRDWRRCKEATKEFKAPSFPSPADKRLRSWKNEHLSSVPGRWVNEDDNNHVGDYIY